MFVEATSLHLFKCKRNLPQYSGYSSLINPVMLFASLKAIDPLVGKLSKNALSNSPSPSIAFLLTGNEHYPSKFNFSPKHFREPSEPAKSTMEAYKHSPLVESCSLRLFKSIERAIICDWINISRNLPLPLLKNVISVSSPLSFPLETKESFSFAFH